MTHLIDGEFQSDKYPTTPRGKVPLSCRDPTAQDLLWRYAQRRRIVDAEFSADLEEALRIVGYVPLAGLTEAAQKIRENAWQAAKARSLSLGIEEHELRRAVEEAIATLLESMEARVSELLAANNAEVERRRAAEAAFSWRPIETLPPDPPAASPEAIAKEALVFAKTADGRRMIWRPAFLRGAMKAGTPEHLQFPAIAWMPVPE